MNPEEIYQRSRSDSLFAELTRRGLVAVFFDWFFGERPSPEELLSWFKARHLKASTGGIHNLISRHGLGYRMGQAREASDSLSGLLPEDADARIKRAVKARTLDLVVSEMGGKEALALERLERESALAEAKLAFARQKHAETTALKRQDLALQREKFEFDATARAIKHAAEIKTITGDRALNAAEQSERVRRLLFPQAFAAAREDAAS